MKPENILAELLRLIDQDIRRLEKESQTGFVNTRDIWEASALRSVKGVITELQTAPDPEGAPPS